MILPVAATSLACWLGWGIWEWSQHRQRLARISLRIHVNGTRGKSTVTRLIAAGLRHGGLRVAAKTTGSAPRFIYPDGQEEEIRRRGRPNIKEQLAMVKKAADLEVDALVLECMAVRPEMQWASARIFPAHVTVITNVRPDHTEIFPTPAHYARTMALTIPQEGWLVTAEDRFLPILEEEAARRGSRVLKVETGTIPAELLPLTRRYPAENVALAAGVLDLLAVPVEVAGAGMTLAAPDPGAFVIVEKRVGDKAVVLASAFAANDPISALELVKDLLLRRPVFLYNHRPDRPARARDFYPLLRHLHDEGYRVYSVGKVSPRFPGITHLGCPEPGELVEKLAAGAGRLELVGVGNIGGYAHRLLDFFAAGGTKNWKLP